jgi:hypothetical protein
LSGFDFLHRPDVQINQFGKFLLCNALGGPFATDTRAEFLQLSVNFGVAWHALLGRNSSLTRTAQWGVICAAPGAAAKIFLRLRVISPSGSSR